MRSVLVGTSVCGRDTVRYYLLAEFQTNETECYGVLVEYRGEMAAAPNITASKSRAMALLEKLQRGSVTPVTLRDIVEDWVLLEG